ncbi:coatomer WD associated region-domain-containing protein [Boletus reticuloceps]|uniref:Coatomer WD associated region-domain-containing protein n=1 Tax=Boletus reticuloceps TaxID=495285 RepID=A0A8I3A4W4_9AGAM|nr:coatomer WD associated region-domain-containing protein [Boletus reticuloceps]
MVSKDLKEIAMQVTSDPDHNFELSLQLDDLDAAVDIVRSIPEHEAEAKVKALDDRALAVWRFDLAREAFERANDLSALMLLLLLTGDRDVLHQLGVAAIGGYQGMCGPAREDESSTRGGLVFSLAPPAVDV